MTDASLHVDQPPEAIKISSTFANAIPLPLISIRKIVEFVAAYYGCPVEKLIGNTRSPDCVLRRRIAAYMASEIRGEGSRIIGDIVRRDDGTIRTGLRKIEARIAKDVEFATEMKTLKAAILRSIQS